jgi:hypothetical protein
MLEVKVEAKCNMLNVGEMKRTGVNIWPLTIIVIVVIVIIIIIRIPLYPT